METFFIHIAARLTKYYSLSKNEAQEMLNDEWEYVEQAYSDGVLSVEDITKELISIYMVA
ncbi:MAG: hypothetical protein WC272_06800 [Sulfurimonas sp.]|jgi:hypothetical protein|nr:hypothetical protein [Sulfurimonas sp.]